MSDERFEELMNWDKLSLVVLTLKIEKENARLRSLIERAKPIIAGCVVEVDDIESQWLKDSEVIGE